VRSSELQESLSEILNREEFPKVPEQLRLNQFFAVPHGFLYICGNSSDSVSGDSDAMTNSRNQAFASAASGLEENCAVASFK
jgi:hypothetical protein